MQFPHCDARVLHAPGECRFCDMHKDWQDLRVTWNIAFTGHQPEAGQKPCPSDEARNLAGAHVWAGNVPQPRHRPLVSWAGVLDSEWVDATQKWLSDEGVCKRAPEGWACSRDDGHDGPCAAWPLDPSLLP